MDVAVAVCVYFGRQIENERVFIMPIVVFLDFVLVVVTRQKGVTYAKYDKLYFCLMFNAQRINNGKMSNSNDSRTTTTTS